MLKRIKRYHRIKSGFVMLVIVLSMTLSSVYPALNSSAASARTAYEYADAYIYYQAWVKCMQGGEFAFGSEITTTQMANGEYFGGGNSNTRLGYLQLSDSASWKCADSNRELQKGLQLFGWTSNIEAFCDFGFSRKTLGGDKTISPANCKNGSGNIVLNGSIDDTVARMKKAIQLKFYGTQNTPTLSNEAEYILYYKSFVKFCAGKQLGTLLSLTRDQQAAAADPSGPYAIVKELDSSNKLVNMVYEVDKGKKVDVYEGSYLPCIEIIDSHINKYASDWENYKQNEGATASDTTMQDDTSPPTTTSSCSIPGIGWVICPVVTFMSSIADGAYKFIEENFLVINVTFFQQTASSNNNATVSDAWGTFRTLTNGGLIVIFLVIIFSQITGLGVSNYGIKKMLPRLIIAAILANLSFIICQLAIDISNLLGKGLYDTLVGQIQNLPVEEGGFLNKGNVWTGIGTAVIGTAAVGTVLWGSLGVLLPVLLAVVLAILMTLLILVARQVLIILLVVLAPVAFLLMILPNTESLYKRWRQIFIALLIVYPTIALLFGASKLAAGVVTSAYGGGADLTTVQGIIGGTIGAAISVLPLFVLPAVLKGSLNAVPMVGNFASKMQSRANSRVVSSARAAYQGGDYARGRAVRRAELEKRRNAGFARRVTGGGVTALPARAGALRAGGQALGRTAQATVNAADAADVQAADAILDRAGDNGAPLTRDQIGELARTGRVANVRRNFNEYERRAAMQRHVASASVEDLHSLVENVQQETQNGNYSDALRQTMGTAIAARRADVPYMSADVSDAVTRGTSNAETLHTAQASAAGGIRPAELATARPQAITAMHEAAQNAIGRARTQQERVAAVGNLQNLVVSTNHLLNSNEASDLRQNIPVGSDLHNALSQIAPAQTNP